jgi:hypothetical protein
MLADLEARKLSHQTVRKYKLLQRQMKAYGEERRLTMLGQFDLDVLRKFRATWKDGPRTAGKKLERLRAFFRFAHDRQWVESNPATRIKQPKFSIRPTSIRLGGSLEGARQRDLASLPRHLRCGTPSRRRPDRARLDSPGPSKRARDGAPLQPLGTLTARATRDRRCAWKLAPVLNQKILGTNRVHLAKGPVN